MSYLNLSIITFSVLLNSIAQLLLKKGTDIISTPTHKTVILDFMFKVILEPYIWLGMIIYGISIGIWIFILSRVDVSIAYPMLSIGFIFNAIAASYLFAEPLNMQKIVGIFIIIIGVWIISKA